MQPSGCRGTIVLLHGHMDTKEQLLDSGRAFAAAGYRAVLIDMRSRGRSGGAFLSFGVQEARDASQVLDALQAQGVVLGPVGFFGRSYGGATAIEAAAIVSRVRAVVAVSSFSSRPRRPGRRRDGASLDSIRSAPRQHPPLPRGTTDFLPPLWALLIGRTFS